MRKIFFALSFFAMASVHAQSDLDKLLFGGISDAAQYIDNYMAPASGTLIHNLSNGWYSSGKAKSLGRFEVSFIANVSLVGSKHRTFLMNENDYQYFYFRDPNISEMEVPTIFGEDTDVEMIAAYDYGNGVIETTPIKLPEGISSSGINLIPLPSLQASAGIWKGTEVKVRFIPKVKIDDFKTHTYGFALQHELTQWLPAAELLPLHVSALVGYTTLNATYDLNRHSGLRGKDQELSTDADSWLFTAIVSTSLPVINFYGGLGYINGSSKSYLNGTYEIDRGVDAGKTLVDPVRIKHTSSGVAATVGFKLQLGFFRLNADYSLQKYNNASLGISFGR